MKIEHLEICKLLFVIMVGCGSNSRYSGSTAEVETILAIASASHAFLLN